MNVNTCMNYEYGSNVDLYRLILSVLYIMVEVMRSPLDTESDEQRHNRSMFIEDLGQSKITLF